MNKFNAKNLSYGKTTYLLAQVLSLMLTNSIESNEPSFLRKLRGEYGGAKDVRHERPLARPRKEVTDGEDEDQPTYVVEGSQDTMSKQEYEALMRKGEESGRGEGKDQTGDEGAVITEGLQKEENSHVGTGSGLAKERVAAIGGAKKKRNITAIGADDKEDGQQGEGKKQRKPKKGKKVKLSFDEAL